MQYQGGTPDTEKSSVDENSEAIIVRSGDRASHSQAVIEVPDGGYGWVVVFACFLFNLATWGANAGFSIYLAYHLEKDSFKGASKLDYSAIGGIALGGGMLFTPLIFRLRDAIGTRLTIIIGGILQFIGTFLAAFSTKLWQLYLTQGVLIGFGLGVTFAPSMVLLPQWFRNRRSLAQSISVCGSGAGGVMFNLATQQITKSIGLKWALIIQSIICIVCTLVGALLVKTRDQSIKGKTTKLWDLEMSRTLPFSLMTLYLAFTILGYVVLLYNLADFTRSLGYSATQGSIVSCMVSVGNFFGRPIVGKLADIFGPITTHILSSILVSLFCFALWIPGKNYSCAIGFALVQGSLMGSVWALLAPITTRLFGLRRLGTMSSMFFVVIGSVGVVSPVIGIELRGPPSGSQLYSPNQYRNPAIYCGVCYFASAVCLWFVRGYLIARDKVAEKEKSHEDNDEMHIRVNWEQVVHGMFEAANLRKV